MSDINKKDETVVKCKAVHPGKSTNTKDVGSGRHVCLGCGVTITPTPDSNRTDNELRDLTESKTSLKEIGLPASQGGQQLNEWELSWVGKLFFAGVAGYLGSKAISAATGGSPTVPKLPIKIKGTPEQIQAIVAAITSSKEFQDEISKPGAKIDQVIQKLNIKNLNKQNFEKLTKKPWPL